MTAIYITVSALTAVALAYAAYMNFAHHDSVIAVAERVRVSQSWMLPLGALLAAGALGLLVGFAVPLIGTAAAVGVVLYFCAAVGAHLRVRDYHFGPAAMFLSLAVATLAVGVADRGLS